MTRENADDPDAEETIEEEEKINYWINSPYFYQSEFSNLKSLNTEALLS